MKKVQAASGGEAGAAPAVRGRKPIFSREHVIEAAQALVDRDGHEGLSMRAVAAEMGTGVATLYHYFQSLAELKDALATRLLEQIPLLDAKDPRETRRQLRSTVIEYSKLAARHPDFEQMVGPLSEQQVMRLLDSALRALLDAGVDAERAGASWSVLQSLAQSHAATSRRLNRARQVKARKELADLDGVQILAKAGVFQKSHEEWFHRILDLTLDHMLPELKSRPARR